MYFSTRAMRSALEASLKTWSTDKRNVLAHRHPRHQRIILEHHTAIRPRSVDRLAIDQHFTCIGLLQTRDQRDQRGLAAAGETDDRDELAFVDAQVDVVEHDAALRAGAVGFGDAFKFQADHTG